MNEEVVLNTRKVAGLLGLDPEVEHAELDSISYTSATGATRTEIVIDAKSQGLLQSIPEPFQDAGKMVRMAISAANEVHEKPMHGVPIDDELIFKGIDAATVFFTFIFQKKDGAMRLIDDIALNIGDIAQVELDRSPGMELFQPGPISQIGGVSPDGV